MRTINTKNQIPRHKLVDEAPYIQLLEELPALVEAVVVQTVEQEYPHHTPLQMLDVIDGIFDELIEEGWLVLHNDKWLGRF